jgi:hypothetical protein
VDERDGTAARERVVAREETGASGARDTDA